MADDNEETPQERLIRVRDQQRQRERSNELKKLKYLENIIDRKNVEKNIVINVNHLAQANYDFSLNPFHEYSEKEINDIYKKIALNHHPDKGGDQEIFKRIANGKEHLLKYLQDQIILNAYDNFSFDEVDDAVYKAFQNIRPARPIPTGNRADMIYNGGNEVKGGEF